MSYAKKPGSEGDEDAVLVYFALLVLLLFYLFSGGPMP